MSHQHDALHWGITRILLSATMIGLFFILAACGSIALRWGNIFNGVGFCEWFLAILVWIAWVGHLAFALLRRKSESMARWLLLTSLVSASLVVGRFASEFGGFARAHEIHKALDAGLHHDCMQLLKHWPKKSNPFRSRVFSDDAEFSSLPESIKMLEPVYVTNDCIDDPNVPPNIGICKNGFGGFAVGVRVFRNDQDAQDFMKGQACSGCQRIAPGVYYWWNRT